MDRVLVLNEPTENVFCPTGPGGGVDPTCSKGGGGVNTRPGPNGQPIPTPDTREGRIMIAKSLRRAVWRVSKGDVKDRCIDTSEALQKIYPEAELLDGYYDGDEFQAHTLAKIGGRYLDVTADQFGGPRFVLSKKLPPEYSVTGGKFQTIQVEPSKWDPRSRADNQKIAEEFLKDLNKSVASAPATNSADIDVEYDSSQDPDPTIEGPWFQPPEAVANSSPERVLVLNEPTENVFCATGPGGGVDPTCSPKGSKGPTGVNYPKGTSPLHKDNAPGSVPEEMRPDLTTDQVRAVQAYSGTKVCKNLNENLRHGEKLNGAAARVHPELQAAFERAPALSSPVTVHRAITVDAEYAGKLKQFAESARDNDGVYQMRGYVSTSTSSTYSGNVRFKINATQGLDMKPYSMFPGEDEVLLNHGSKFKVRKVSVVKGELHIELDQIAPKGHNPEAVSGRKKGLVDVIQGLRGRI